MAAIPDIGYRPPIRGWRELVVCQVLGLVALALILYVVMGGKYGLLRYAVVLAPVFLIIPRPNLIPYAFILSFFAFFTVYRAGWMLQVTSEDVILLIMVFAFLARNRIDFGVVVRDQRRLFVLLSLFLLWAAVGWVANVYSHELLANITSAVFIFTVFQLIVVVVLFSQPQWEAYRGKAFVFYLICVVFEILAAFGLEVLGGARSLSDFSRMCGTLGGNHGMLGNVLLLSFGAAVGAYFTLSDRFYKVFALCVGIACLVTLFLSGSRGCLMGLILALPVTVFLGFRLKKSTLVLAFLSMIAGFAIFWLSPLRDVLLGAMSVDSMDISAYGRILIWERVYEHALYGPWLQKIFGIGIGTFNTLRFNYFLEVGMFTTGAHNNFMHAFVETGIVGLVIYLAIFAEIVRRLAARSRRGDNAARCFLVATLALLFSCLTQETFWFNPAFGRFWLMYMFCYVALLNFHGDPRPASQK